MKNHNLSKSEIISMSIHSVLYPIPHHLRHLIPQATPHFPLNLNPIPYHCQSNSQSNPNFP